MTRFPASSRHMKQKIDDAVPRIFEAYEIVLKLGRAEGVAVIGMTLGQILAANDEREDARRVLQLSAEMYGKLGREESARRADDLIRRLGLA
jgi:hypothetical protein